MKTGWVQIYSKWYYFDATGAMKTGWISDNSKDYCMYSSGVMICNKRFMREFDSNGVAIKLS